MNLVRIDHPDDAQIADYRNVPDPELIARRGLFVAEGRLVVERLLTSGRWTPRSLLVTETALAAVRGAVDQHPSVRIYLVDQPVMNAITGFNIHRGCLALGERRPLPEWRALAQSARILVVLERLGNADNVGAIFRNSAAFGVDAVLLGPACADPLYRKAIRTSMGAALSVPFAHAEPWPAPLAWLRDDGWAVVALTPSAAASVREAAPALNGRRIAVVVGHEGDGLTPAALDACTHHAHVPMVQGVDSLNVATAAAVALYEFSEAGREAPPHDRSEDRGEPPHGAPKP
jgi:tRNA G18 (ribose-2'-O)-methylase SpoU